jgi:hypothetical protein
VSLEVKLFQSENEFYGHDHDFSGTIPNLPDVPSKELLSFLEPLHQVHVHQCLHGQNLGFLNEKYDIREEGGPSVEGVPSV